MKKRKNPNKAIIKAASKFQPWDYSFMLNVELKMLKNMQQYFVNSHLTDTDSKIAKQIELALNILKISQNIDVISYVNTKNAHRFGKYTDSDHYGTNIQLRQDKAWHLYNKLRTYYMLTWWN